MCSSVCFINDCFPRPHLSFKSHQYVISSVCVIQTNRKTEMRKNNFSGRGNKMKENLRQVIPRKVVACSSMHSTVNLKDSGVLPSCGFTFQLALAIQAQQVTERTTKS